MATKKEPVKKVKRATHPPQTIKKLSIWEKVYNVQQNVAPVFKVNPGETDSYPYTRERDIIGEVKPMLREQRLMYFFTTKSAGVIEGDIKKRRLSITFTLVNVDKPTETIITDMETEGENRDTGATGIAGAYTMATKYYFAKMFMIEIEDSVDDNSKKGAAKKPDQTTEYEKSKKLIDSTRNLDGLMEFQEQVRTGKFFNGAQKADLEKRIAARITELQNA